MKSRQKRSHIGWDVTIGILLVACGLLLAIHDRGLRPALGNAALRAAAAN